MWNLAFPCYIKSITETPNTFLFTFVHEHDKQRVVEGAPWAISNQLLILRNWDPELKVEKIDFTVCQFCIQIHGQRLNQKTKQNAQQIGKIFHWLIAIDSAADVGVSVGTYMRLKVEIDVRKPLVESITNKKSNGNIQRVRIRA
ncbi:hypothetical protein GH714_000889 [Hevea brasiliensis]|uniref:DUF4283 domain-containing protein n=1 Tax=Hevea brasiliensis TaxID=3981 RepID=A0A6A6KAF5_HEVBR|nr:hypothetical protein GH714_000889 [Hevea brasiliensis]